MLKRRFLARNAIRVLSFGLLSVSVISVITTIHQFVCERNNQQKDEKIESFSGCSYNSPSIMFLKTHKTGSSTVTNIINRYVDKHYDRVSIVLPEGKTRYTFGWPNRFQLKYVSSLRPEPRILCNHARLSKVPLNALFPKERSFYLTILREPVAHFESVYYYFRLQKIVGANMENFLTGLDFEKWKGLKNKHYALMITKNPIMFDLGLPVKFYENRTEINKYVRFLDQEFDLVLVLEHFDESLVLMKRLLCWSMEDILYFKHMQRIRIDKNKEYISTSLERKIKDWNQADVMLYNYFNASLWRKIEREGPEFYDDLRQFRGKLHRIKKTCIYGRDDNKYMGYQLKNSIHNSTRDLCEKMIFEERLYVDYFRAKSSGVAEDDGI